jgi:hypothetical protein
MSMRVLSSRPKTPAEQPKIPPEYVLMAAALMQKLLAAQPKDESEDQQ